MNKQLSVSGERICTSTAQPLRGLGQSRKSVVRLTDWLENNRDVIFHLPVCICE